MCINSTKLLLIFQGHSKQINFGILSFQTYHIKVNEVILWEHDISLLMSMEDAYTTLVSIISSQIKKIKIA